MAKTKKQEDQEELERIKRQRKLSDWNQGKDLTLDTLGEAERLFTDRGYTAAKRADTPEERARNREVARRAMEAEPSQDLPGAAKSYVRRKQVEIGKQYAQFMRDADEFAGKPVGNYEPLTPRWKQREEAAKIAGEDARKKGDEDFDKYVKGAKTRRREQGGWSDDDIQAADYWKNWQDNPDGSKSRTAFFSKDDDRGLTQIQTPSGGYVSARGGSKNGVDVAANMQASIDRDLDKETRLADMRAKGREIRDRLDGEQRDALTARLKEAGIENAPTKKDGSFDADRAKGMLAQRTFETWDEEKRMLATGKEQQKMDRQRLRLVNQALREGRGDAAALQAEKLGLQNSTQYMDDRDLTAFGKRREQTALADIERAKAIQNSQKNQADALLQRAEAANFSLSDEQLKTFGLPALTDEEGWQKAIAENPFLQQFYNSLKLPKVSKTGQAMSKALSAFV